jgi:hypothetical protein
MGFRRAFAAIAMAMCFGMACFALPASAAPASDAFFGAPAFDITGTRGMALADLTGASRETGEPVVSGSATANTVWWRYIAPANGWAKFSGCAPAGANPLPQMSLGVYTGNRVDLLTTVAQGTNNCPAGYENAQVGPFAVTAGSYYWLQIGGASSLAADENDAAITLDFNPSGTPPNDNWANAMTISGALPQTFAANNGLATVEAAEPNSTSTIERSTLWYKWTAPANGVVSINTCGSAVESGMDSVLSVFSGTTPATFGDLSLVDEQDNGCTSPAQNMSRVYLNATSGTKYWIKLSNYTLDWGFPYALELKWITKPDNGQLPSFSPTKLKVGQTANGNDGLWAGDPAPSTSRQWRRCDSAGNNCVDIAGATGLSYVPVLADKGSTLRLRVTATNVNGSTSADSAPSEVVDDTPANDLWANRTDLGTGSTVTIDDDNNFATTEAGEPTIAGFTARNSVWYKWKPAVGGDYVINNCLGAAVIPDYLDLLIGVRTGTTSLATTVVAGGADNGCGPYHQNRTSMLFNATAGTEYSIQVASRINLSTGAFRLSIAPVGNPVVTAPPLISGNPAPGSQLSLDRGDWISPTTIVPVVHWSRCDAAGNNCVDTGNTGQLYDLTVADAGAKIKATVTLTNSYGTITSTVFSPLIAQDSDGDGVLDVSDSCPSEPGNKPNGCAPSDIVGTGAPMLTGSLFTGQTVSSSTGGWSVLHDPLGYTLGYQWQRCADATPASCVDIVSATGASHLLAAPDLGSRVRAVVTASNADDIETQATAISAVVAAPPPAPANTGLPSVSGSPVVGASLGTTDGSWTPAGTTFTYAWLRCTDNVSIGSCTTIAGATNAGYALVAADLGRYMRAQVTATNVSGAASAVSAASAVVSGDSDGDGVPDVSDSCPTEAGNRPNGCMPSVVTGSGAPGVTGTLLVGQTVNSSQGGWTVLHDPLPLSFAYQWQRCADATPASCVDIGGANSSIYVLQGSDYASRIRIQVTASNTDSSATQYSAISSPIGQIPGNLALPVISGTALTGQSLTTTNGSWTPADTTFAYSWLRCTDNTSVGSCTTITGATASSYTIVGADTGKYIRSRVTGTTGAGSDYASSAPSAIVGLDSDGDGVPDAADSCPSQAGARPNGCPPSVITPTAPPTLSGVFNVGQSISSSTGSWSVTGDPLGYALTYQWQRCPDTTPANCTNIGGATGSAYTLTASDYAKRVRVLVTATNADGSANQASAISGVVGQAPVNNTPPSISGTAKVGQVLTGSQGLWSPADATLGNQWLRCTDNASSGSCSPIAGATAATYTLLAADDGKFIRLRVTATTAAGTSSVDSAASAQVVTDSDGDGVPDAADSCPSQAGARPNGCPPSVITPTAPPTLSGVFNVGQSISSSTGSWSVTGDPLGYALTYQWQRCPDTTPANCTNIGGATGSAYTLTASDYAKRVRVLVTATNADGSANQASAISGVVGQAPVNNTPPSISGTAKVGQVLTGDGGSWTPADATLSYAWQRCYSGTPASCAPIPGATGTTYTIADADEDKYIRVQVTATTAAGSSTLLSAATAQVVKDSDGDGVKDSLDACPTEAGAKPNGCPPSDIVGTGPPSVTGNLVVGQQVTGTTGSWTVLHDQLGYSLTYQWQRCPDTTPANCVDIAGETSAAHTVQLADDTNRLRVIVTATNADDTASQASAITTPVIPAGSAPVNNAAPAVSGSTVEGQTLSAITAATDWTPADATLAHQWLRCSDAVSTASCSAIAGATGSSHLLTADDVGAYIRVRVTATANALNTSADSPATAVITAAPVPPAPGGPGGSGGGTPPKNPAEINGPAKLKAVKAAQKGARATFTQVSVYCGTKSTGKCTGSAVLAGRVGAKLVTFGRTSLSTLRGGGTTISIKLSSKARRALKKRSIKIQLTVTYSAPGFTPLNYSTSGSIKKLR